ncbi:RraA family protein [Streptomyces longwoodensis]|uniref:RraA family protein n=1 Tax=Streptomyces longwoodensis TaxID=68231 RepID=UPI0033CD113A
MTTPTAETGPHPFTRIPTTTLADLLGRARVMDLGIRPLWGPGPRLAGPAFTVRCPPGDNLMLHAAIHRAPAGSVIVVESGDLRYALAGGNVCAVAQRRGIAGFVLDGLIRDLAETREAGFPVYARGVVPVPGAKAEVRPLDEPVDCGGVRMEPGDVVVADEEGVVVVPSADTETIRTAAETRLRQEATQTLSDWESAHRIRIDALLAEGGFRD